MDNFKLLYDLKKVKQNGEESIARISINQVKFNEAREAAQTDQKSLQKNLQVRLDEKQLVKKGL